MTTTTASREAPILQVVDLWVRMSRLSEFLEQAKSEGDLQKVKERARKLIRNLAVIPDVHAIPRGRILQTLERLERDPSSDPATVAELRRAMCRCNNLLDRHVDSRTFSAAAETASA